MSSSRARTCSGDMYETVPMVLPGLVRWSGSTPWVAKVSMSIAGSFAKWTFASPKSRIFAWPRLVMKILAGLMSR